MRGLNGFMSQVIEEKKTIRKVRRRKPDLVEEIITTANLPRALPPNPKKKNPKVQKTQKKFLKTLTPAGTDWLLSYLMPTEEDLPNEIAVPPDSALPMAATAVFQFAGTLQIPKQEASVTSIGDRNYSRLDLMFPLSRYLKFICISPIGAEFGDEEQDIICDILNNASDELMTYPRWLSSTEQVDFEPGVKVPRIYVTAIDTDAMRYVQRPTDSGGSTFASAFRFASWGTRVDFNAPDLLNQGTYVGGQFGFNAKEETFNMSGPRAVVDIKVHVIATNLIIRSSGFVLPDWTNPVTPDLSTPFELMHRIHLYSGTIIGEVGEKMQWAIVVSVGFGHNLMFRNITTGVDTLFMTMPGPQVAQNIRLYYDMGLDDPESSEGAVNCLVIQMPATAQGSIKQQNRKAPAMLLKEGGGYAMPMRIQNVVMNTQQAGANVLCKFATSRTKPEDIYKTGGSGITSAPDPNFGTGVVSMVGVSYAAALLENDTRVVQYVGAPHSIVGVFSRSHHESDSNAIMLAKAIDNRVAQVLPAKDNFLGTMLNSAIRVLDNLENKNGSMEKAVDSACRLLKHTQLSPRKTNLLANY